MTEQNHAVLARRKQDSVSGGDVNYYLFEVPAKRHGVACVVEAEDVIEALDMEFAEANVFKALVRGIKLRHHLSKPGSTALYEAQKMVYYSDRALVKAKRRRLRSLFTVLDEQRMIIEVPDPKRLSPYTVHVDDLIDALDPTTVERELMTSILQLCITIRDSRFSMMAGIARASTGTQSPEVALAERASVSARLVLEEAGA